MNPKSIKDPIKRNKITKIVPQDYLKTAKCNDFTHEIWVLGTSRFHKSSDVVF